MGQTNRRTSARPALAVVLAVSFSALQPAAAADSLASEREQLAALTRQLDLIDRLAEHAANTAPQEHARYHFDYARLRADLNRVRAGLQGVDESIPADYPDYVLHTMVRVMKGGEEVKISKRAGSYVTLRDLIEWTSTDAVRFFLLSRKPDTEYTFDVDLAVTKNNDNPVYYVQYAHARICSVLASWGGDVASLHDVELLALESPAAQELMLLLAKYPDMLTAAAKDFAPHDVTFYLRELAASYHSYYDAERILVVDESVKKARLALVAATARVLHNGLAILGVNAPSKM